MPENWPEMTRRLKEFYAVWDETRSHDRSEVPFRRQLSLAKMRALTPFLVVLQMQEDGEIIVKLSGTEIDAQFGRNMTGVHVSSIAEPEAAKATLQFHRAMITHPCAGFAHDMLVTETGKRISARYLMLPLRDEQGQITMSASLCDPETAGFSAAPSMQSTRITYKEFVGAELMDIGFGVPKFSHTIKTKHPLKW